MNMKMKALKISWMLVVILTCNLFFVSCFSEDNPVSEKQQSEAVFQKQLDEALERKCRTDNSKPFELKDLARTTVLCEYDSIRVVIDDIKSAATEYDAFGRHKHQTSDYGYWGDIINLAFYNLQTEIQVKSYRMYYAVNPKDICQPVLGDSLYNVIHTETGLEPGLAHHYYEIMRADTASAATRERYRKLSIEYLSHFDKDYVK